MEDENDELISRLNPLKPVEPVVAPDPDTEYFDKQDELERERDNYFDKRARIELYDKLPVKKKK